MKKKKKHVEIYFDILLASAGNSLYYCPKYMPAGILSAQRTRELIGSKNVQPRFRVEAASAVTYRRRLTCIPIWTLLDNRLTEIIILFESYGGWIHSGIMQEYV